jgi:hypothetical protein
MAVGSIRDFGTQKGRRALLSDAMVAVAATIILPSQKTEGRKAAFHLRTATA